MRVCYLIERAYSGTFHDAAQEEQVDVFGSRGGGQLAQVIQHLLHGWVDAPRDKRSTDRDKEKRR